MIEKKFTNNDLEIELTSYIDDKQNIWFKGKDIAHIHGYSDTEQALRKNIDPKDRKSYPVYQTGQVRRHTFINEYSFYSLILSSKLEIATTFKHWVTSQVLPSKRKYGKFRLFDNPNKNMFKIENETDLHCKVVQYMRSFYPDAIIVAGLGENQDTPGKRMQSWKKGYMKSQPDIVILNYNKSWKGFCLEFKSPTNNYKVSESQLKMKKHVQKNGFFFKISSDYDLITKSPNI